MHIIKMMSNKMCTVRIKNYFYPNEKLRASQQIYINILTKNYQHLDKKLLVSR